jgi:peptidoglycan/xylan/chitin deacetylase (PgdA/CDA1 family)
MVQILTVAGCLALPAMGSGPPARRMVVTVDDLPAQRLASPAALQKLTRGLVDALRKHRIPAVGFVNESKLRRGETVDPGRVKLLERWLDAGLELGNHSYSHLDLHRVPLPVFLADVEKGEAIARPLAATRQRPYRYFRHPFLHTGKDLATRQAVEGFLAEHGYRVAPVTIDNSEWIFARAYDEALDRRDRRLEKRIATAYLEYMEAMCAYYEGQSRALFEREIPQVLLIHANTLNAHHLDALLRRLERRGYRFVELSQALADPAFASPDQYTGPGGITWLHRWALTRGVPPALFQGEPRTLDWIQETAGIRE